MDALVLKVKSIKIGEDYDNGDTHTPRCSISMQLNEDVRIETPSGPTTIQISKAWATVYVTEEVARAMKRGTKFKLSLEEIA